MAVSSGVLWGIFLAGSLSVTIILIALTASAPEGTYFVRVGQGPFPQALPRYFLALRSARD